MVKNFLISILFLFNFSVTFSQVGINTDKPNTFSSLDIDSENSGILIPRVKLTSTKDNTTVSVPSKSLSVKENSLLIYNTNTSNIYATSVNPNDNNFDEIENVYPGFYYWEIDRWIRLSNKNDKQFFYMPSVVIPTHSSQVSVNQSIGNVNLYEIYKQQFSSSNVKKNPSSTTKLPIYKNFQLDYYITWYDPKVFRNVEVSNAGVLTYEVLTTDEVVLGSFMNIVFVVK